MNPRILSFHYTLRDKEGQLLDSSAGGEPLSILEGQGQIIPRLEAELLTLAVGEKRSIRLPAAEAYGVYRPELVVDVPREQLDLPDVKVGQRLRAQHHPVVFTVVGITETHIRLDANHPLAGRDLIFELELTDSRPATATEIASMHSCCSRHGQGGCSRRAPDGTCS